MTGALFVPEADGFRATDYTRGPWSDLTLHGGPVVGLLAHAVSQAVPPDAPAVCTRLTVEMHRPVPLDLLHVGASIIKPGRRVMVIDAELRHDGVLIGRASSHWGQTPGTAAPVPGDTPPRPTEPQPRADDSQFDYPNPGFNCDAAELRYVVGSHEESGPGTSWLRLTSPLIAGRSTTPFETAATLSDLAAAAGWEYSPAGLAYINPDLTLQLARLPVGEWIAIAAHVEHGGGETALLTARMFDAHGPFARVLQSLIETPAP